MPSSAALHYRVELADRHAHLFSVTLTIRNPAAGQLVSMPVWIPGSYLVREFSRNLQQLGASQAGMAVPLRQLDKCSWRVQCSGSTPLVLRYLVYAFDNSVRSAWLDSRRGFFNGTSLFLQVAGQEHAAHGLQLVADPLARDWSVATALTPQRVTARGFGSYLAADYDELVDSPVEMGAFWSGAFTACGVAHRFVVAGATPSFDGARLLADSQRICEAAIHFWHGAGTGKRLNSKPLHRRYVFMLNAVDDGYGGLEHRASTALICNRKDLPRRAAQSGADKQPEGYTTLLGLISHEYFHTWNVKRLRPIEFARYGYGQENYTELLWFFEGFTSYYDDLLLRRAKLIDDPVYLKLLGKTINQVLQTPGRAVQSVAAASFDAWVKYYRQDENTPNLTVSYYTKGALVALCLDLTLRGEGRTSLDQVMRALWRRCKGGPMTEEDLGTVLLQLGGRCYAAELSAWVHGTAELPLRPLLERAGVSVTDEPAQLAQRLGLRVTEAGSIRVKTVLRGGAADAAGLCAGDEWLGVETGPDQCWRLLRLDDLTLYLGPARQFTALVARDQRLLRLHLELPAALCTWRLGSRDAAQLVRWLGAQTRPGTP